MPDFNPYTPTNEFPKQSPGMVPSLSLSITSLELLFQVLLLVFSKLPTVSWSSFPLLETLSCEYVKLPHKTQYRGTPNVWSNGEQADVQGSGSKTSHLHVVFAKGILQNSNRPLFSCLYVLRVSFPFCHAEC